MIGPKALVAYAEALAPHNQQYPGNQADRHPPCRPDPVVFEGVVQKKGDSYQHRRDAYAVEPVRADAGFKIDLRGRDVSLSKSVASGGR